MDGGAMSEPGFAALAALLGDPARSRMLTALMGGTALTATELALQGAVSASTASTHLAKLTEAKILKVVRQGRHRYFRLFDQEVASMLENLMEIASRDAAPQRRRPAPALAAARVCYDHLAGASGVWMACALRDRRLLAGDDQFELTPAGERFFSDWKIDLDALRRARRPLCRACLDWSERRFHLGGALGTAILQRVFALRWARRELDSRAVVFSSHGGRAFRALFLQ
jgi:DNA-binding transcriptional ArsR family regulator